MLPTHDIFTIFPLSPHPTSCFSKLFACVDEGNLFIIPFYLFKISHKQQCWVLVEFYCQQFI